MKQHWDERLTLGRLSFQFHWYDTWRVFECSLFFEVMRKGMWWGTSGPLTAPLLLLRLAFWRWTLTTEWNCGRAKSVNAVVTAGSQ